jgi:hypothetical protein
MKLTAGLLLQRCEVVIDACMIGASDSVFLQQAAHLTNGIYLRPKHKGALLQYLLVCTVSSCCFLFFFEQCL